MIGQIGQFDTRVLLQLSRSTVDAQGSAVEEWQDTGEVWAKIEDLSASETTSGNAREASADCKFTLRYQRSIATVGPTYRIKSRNEFYDIISIIPFPPGRPDRLILIGRRNTDGGAMVFETSYILDGSGGRVSDGNGGFLSEN